MTVQRGLNHLRSLTLAWYACAFVSLAATHHDGPVPSGSKLFIAPMENGLDGFIAPEIIKKIPVLESVRTLGVVAPAQRAEQAVHPTSGMA